MRPTIRKKYIVTPMEEERRMLQETLLCLSSIRRTTLDTSLSPCITDTYTIRLRVGILPASEAATARAIAAVVCPSSRAATPPSPTCCGGKVLRNSRIPTLVHGSVARPEQPPVSCANPAPSATTPSRVLGGPFKIHGPSSETSVPRKEEYYEDSQDLTRLLL